MFLHYDLLSELNKRQSLNQKLMIIHKAVKERFEFIDRISVASYDNKTGLLKTFLASSGNDRPIYNYSALLKDAPSLNEIVERGCPRVINDLTIFDFKDHEHTQKIKAQGYAASYTMPMYLNGLFAGFTFFNSYQKGCFEEDVLCQLDVFGHLISSVTVNETNAIKVLLAALKTANEMVHFRDPETGGHLDRMSRYSRLIAQELTALGKYKFNDEYIEHIFLFAPLHDIGKIGIPDNILLKPDRLNEHEFEIMKTHTTKGRLLIDAMLENFGLESFNSIDVLRNIAESHHEAMDGSGYPRGLAGKEIPIEARIVAVADIFDALTSERSYKPAWNNDEAFTMLSWMAKTQLDQNCVDILINNRSKIEQLQKAFRDHSMLVKNSAG
jgi:HD-GYP domain-containing protein (c-di-GMP phosphodiesterase class II)